jgi:hypothetical protein
MTKLINRNKREIKNKKIIRAWGISLLWLCAFLPQGSVSAEILTPSEAYYNEHIASTAPVAELPSESYYNKHLRNEWIDDGGPGGSGIGDNTGVAVSVENGYLPVLAAALVYFVVIYRGRKNKEKEF